MDDADADLEEGCDDGGGWKLRAQRAAGRSAMARGYSIGDNVYRRCSSNLPNRLAERLVTRSTVSELCQNYRTPSVTNRDNVHGRTV
jgi:hypothetical protein